MENTKSELQHWLGRLGCGASALLVLVAFSSACANARSYDLGRQGYWTFSAYYDDSGKFSFCDMKTGSEVGSESFSLSISRAGFLVSLFDSNWGLKEGDSYESRTRIGDDYWEGEAVVFGERTIIMKFAFDSGFGQAFAKGTRMEFQIGEFSRALDLRGSSSALDTVARCFAKRVPNANPFGKARGDENPFE